MGYIMSENPKINNQCFEPFPKRGWKSKNTRCVVVRKTPFVYCEITKVIYTTDYGMSRNIVLCDTGSCHDAIIALKKLGLITEKELQEHGQPKRMRDEAYEIAQAAVSTIDTLAAAGIELTPAQKRKRTALRKITRKNLEEYMLPHWFRKEVEKALEGE